MGEKAFSNFPLIFRVMCQLMLTCNLRVYCSKIITNCNGNLTAIVQFCHTFRRDLSIDIGIGISQCLFEAKLQNKAEQINRDILSSSYAEFPDEPTSFLRQMRTAIFEKHISKNRPMSNCSAISSFIVICVNNRSHYQGHSF